MQQSLQQAKPLPSLATEPAAALVCVCGWVGGWVHELCGISSALATELSYSAKNRALLHTYRQSLATELSYRACYSARQKSYRSKPCRACGTPLQGRTRCIRIGPAYTYAGAYAVCICIRQALQSVRHTTARAHLLSLRARALSVQQRSATEPAARAHQLSLRHER